MKLSTDVLNDDETMRSFPVPLYLVSVVLIFPSLSPLPVLLQCTDLHIDPNTLYIRGVLLIERSK
jgi:hypothetical protein